jgi:hypothetical protein
VVESVVESVLESVGGRPRVVSHVLIAAEAGRPGASAPDVGPALMRRAGFPAGAGNGRAELLRAGPEYGTRIIGECPRIPWTFCELHIFPEAYPDVRISCLNKYRRVVLSGEPGTGRSRWAILHMCTARNADVRICTVELNR